MKDSQGTAAEGRTNWRRFGLVMIAPTVVAVGLVGGVASGAVAASFSISGTSFKLGPIKARRGVVAAQTSKFSLKLNKGSFADDLSDEGLIDIDAKDEPVIVPVIVLFNQTLFSADVTQKYNAKQGKSGRTK